MSEPVSPSTAIAVRDEGRDVARPLPPMNDAEVAAAYRTARAFAEGGLFKDARSAGAAFTKILAGRDFGLTPFESMSGLHVFDGKVEAGADLHATKIRQRDGYDFRVAWLKIVKAGDPPQVEAVWADEEDLADLRETYGCAIMFTVDGKSRGVSRFTHDDAVKAKLEKKDNHSKYPRNMFYARAMTNGTSWYVPEAMGGLRVYGLGEIPREPDLTDVDGDATSGAEVDLPMAVEAIVARASTLGYAPLANRSAVAMAVDGQSAEFVQNWCHGATRDLNRYAAGRAEPEPVDADVVEHDHIPTAAEVHMQPGLAHARRVGLEQADEQFAPPTPDEQAAADELGVGIVSQGFLDDGPPRRADPRSIDATIAEHDAAERTEALRARALRLLDEADALDADGDERAAEVRQEAEALMDQVDAAQPPEQGSLGL